MPGKPSNQNILTSNMNTQNQNTPKSNVYIGEEATKRLIDGIKVATQAIRPTYGAKGRNAVIEHEFQPYHVIANDAQTIVQAIEVEGDVEKQGLSFVKELMEKANKDSGDGRKTTAIILEEILDQGIKSQLSGLELKRKLDSLIPFIEAKIDEQKKTITEAEVYKVAAIAGESESIGKTLGKIYERIGKDGIIIPEASNTYTTSVSYIEGVRFTGTGYLSPFMVHDEVARKEKRKETQAIYEKPLILVTKRKIQHLNDINPLLEELSKQGKKDLVIFTDDMDSGVASIIVKAHQDKVMNILIIKAPVLWKQYIFEDFAKITGATIVEDASGITFKNLKLEHLGTCGKITVDKDETTVVGIADISDHIQSLKEEGSDDSKLRLSWLQTKTAILKLGANNESELSYLRLKCYDAINASRLALRDGVVKGGGVCLYDIADRLIFQTATGNLASIILQNALIAPLYQNLTNMGIDTKDFKGDFGDNIIDSATVIKNAVRNAISLASTILTTGLVVTLPKKSPEQIAAEALQNKGFRM